jgi:hypothetical protein
MSDSVAEAFGLDKRGRSAAGAKQSIVVAQGDHKTIPDAAKTGPSAGRETIAEF